MRTFPLAVVVAAFVASPIVVDAATQPVVVLPQAVGQRVHVHLVRTVQGATGPLAAASDVDLVRSAATTLVVERPQPGGAPTVAVETLRKDGSIAVSDDARGVTGDGDLADILDALNAASAALHGADAVYHGAWTTPVPLVPAFNGATAMTAFATTNASPAAFDFAGDGTTTGSTAGPAGPNPNSAQQRAQGGFGGRFPGGGSRGGGRGGSPRGGSDAGRDASMPTRIGMHVEGRESGGHVERLTITETRSIVVDATPFVNVSSWAMTFATTGPTRIQASP